MFLFLFCFVLLDLFRIPITRLYMHAPMAPGHGGYQQRLILSSYVGFNLIFWFCKIKISVILFSFSVTSFPPSVRDGQTLLYGQTKRKMHSPSDVTTRLHLSFPKRSLARRGPTDPLGNTLFPCHVNRSSTIP